MKRQHLYFIIFILGILIGSSLYLSWSVDRGMGQISVQRMTLEREPGRPVEILVYQPRDEALGGLLEPTPIIMSLHGLADSKEGMYPFNIELARRNFTVVSIDLPGHGDSTLPFDITDFNAMAEDAYYALRHVQTTFQNVHNETYGIVAHSFGVRVGIELVDYPLTPMAFAAVGDVGQMALSEYPDLPDDLLIAAGFSSSIVSETTSWLVQKVQGDSQLAITLDPNSQIFFRKTIATITGSFFLLISTIPILILVYDTLSERLRPRKIPVETESFSLQRTFLLSSLMGATIVIIFIFTMSGGLYLEGVGIAWPNSMFATGLLVSYFIGLIGLFILMRIFMGKEHTRLALSSISVERLRIKVHVVDIAKSLVIVTIPIAWIIIWLAIAGLPETMNPYTVMMFLRWPVGIRVMNTFLLAILSIPFLLVEAAWIRGLLLSERDWKGGEQYHLSDFKKITFALVARLAVSSVCVVIVVFTSTALGLNPVLGYLLLLITIIQVFATFLTVFTAIKFENTWPAVILVAFLLAIVTMTNLPLI
ncbi:MAG: alpha/beta fold hydrolase [Candidatus Thorarchaeota archaeon]